MVESKISPLAQRFPPVAGKYTNTSPNVFIILLIRSYASLLAGKLAKSCSTRLHPAL